MSIDNELIELTSVAVDDFKRYGCKCTHCKGAKGDPDAEHRSNGAPRVKNPNGKWVTYRRPSSFGKPLEDTYGLDKWKLRMACYGVATTQALAAKIANCHPDEDKQKLNDYADQALEAAKANEAADLGTELHRVVERLNRGLWTIDDVPDMFRRDAEAYLTAIGAHYLGVVPGMVELRVVNDEVRCGGTFDMMMTDGGTNYCADLKTGQSITLSQVSYTVQGAIYARGVAYDVVKDERYDIPAMDADLGFIVHLPYGSGRCDIIEMNLAEGWKGAKLAHAARSWNRRSDLFTARAPKIDGGGTNDHGADAESSPVAVVAGTVEEPETKPGRPRRPITPPIKPVPADQREPRPPSGAAPEGGECTQEQIDKLREEIAALGPAKAHVTRWKDEAAVPVGKAPGPAWGITNNAGRTIRRFALALTACALADLCHTDDEAEVDDLARQCIALALQDEDVVQTHPVGRLIGVLTLDEARKVRKVAMASTVDVNEDDRPVIRAA